MKRSPLRLSQPACAALREALGGDLPAGLLTAIERHLTAYRDLDRWTAADRRRWRQEDTARLQAARQLLALLPSPEDVSEMIASGREHSELIARLRERIAQWEARPPQSGRTGRQEDWNRRVLLWRVLDALDAARVPETYSRDGARVRVLQFALKCADRIDHKKTGQGSQRLIQDVYRDRRQRHTWGPRHILRLRYASPGLWPRDLADHPG